MSVPDVHGPIDFLIVEFPAGAAGERTAAAILDLVERATVRLFDLMVVRADAEGACSEVDLTAADGPLSALAPLAGARSGLLGADDVNEVSGALDPNTAAVVLLYENTWAIPFVAAAVGEGGQLVASSRLNAQEVMDALDATEPD